VGCSKNDRTQISSLRASSGLLQNGSMADSFLRMVTGCAMRYSNSSPTASAEAPATMEWTGHELRRFTVSSILHRRLPVPRGRHKSAAGSFLVRAIGGAGPSHIPPITPPPCPLPIPASRTGPTPLIAPLSPALQHGPRPASSGNSGSAGHIARCIERLINEIGRPETSGKAAPGPILAGVYRQWPSFEHGFPRFRQDEPVARFPHGAESCTGRHLPVLASLESIYTLRRSFERAVPAPPGNPELLLQTHS